MRRRTGTIALSVAGGAILAGLWMWRQADWMATLLLAYVIANLVTPVAMIAGVSLRAIDMPNERKVHGIPIPRFGGLAIMAGMAAVMMVHTEIFDRSAVIGLTLGGLVIWVIGVADDMRGVPALAKLVGQLMASGIAVAYGIRIECIQAYGPMEIWLEVVVTLVWLVGVMNAFNFLDGLDGLASGLAMICAVMFFRLASMTGQLHLSILAIAVAGSVLGFLPYNLRPAKIFLGDSGSTVLGFFLAGFGVMGTWAEDHPLVALTIPVLILGVPIFDMIYTTISRIRNHTVRSVRQWLEYVGKDHFHHRLVTMGFSNVQAVWFIQGVTLTLGLSAVVLHGAEPVNAVLMLVQGIVIFLLIVALMLAGRETDGTPLKERRH